MIKESETERGSDETIKSIVKKSLVDFETALDNDLNTSQALAVIHTLVRDVNTASSRDGLNKEARKVTLEAIEKFDFVLGIFGKEKQEILNKDIKNLIKEREAARRNRDFARSDEIRNFLLEKGIILEDTREGVRWKKR